MKLFMAKVLSSDDNSTRWFLVSAHDEASVRVIIEDCTSSIVRLISDPAEIAAVIAGEFDDLALLEEPL